MIKYKIRQILLNSPTEINSELTVCDLYKIYYNLEIETEFKPYF